MKKFKYHSPKSLDESRKIFMSCEFPQYLAGGMTLLPSIKQGLSSPTDLIDLAHINDMKGINEDNNNISVGSLVNHNEIAKSHLIKKYMSNFFGYGNLKSDYWFIGIEEGGGKTEKEVIDRIKTWNMFGENTVEDLAKFHKKINNPLAKMGSYFPLTWQSYIRIVFALNADRKFLILTKINKKQR